MKKALALILALALLLALPACGGSAQPQTVTPEPTEEPTPEPTPDPTPEPFDLAGYKASAKELADLISDNNDLLFAVFEHEISYMSSYKKLTGSYPSEKSTLESTQSWYEENGGTWSVFEENYTLISGMYKEFLEKDPSGNVIATDIYGYIKSMYENYNVIYTAATQLEDYTNALDAYESIRNTAKVLNSSYLA